VEGGGGGGVEGGGGGGGVGGSGGIRKGKETIKFNMPTVLCLP